MTEWVPPDRSRSRAVLIGTSRYDHLPQVPAAANSLESMRRLLTRPLCAWPDDRVTMISNREAPGDLPDLLVELFTDAKDAALFFYVGHGQVDFENQLCLGLVGSRDKSERRATTGLTFDAVRRAMTASTATTKVVILDCCRAGHAAHPPHTLSGGEDVDISGAYILAATGPGGTAWFEADTDSPPPHTHFTRALIETVNRGVPGEPAALTLESVYRRVWEVLHAAARPVPTCNSRGRAGDFIFARNVAPPPARESSASPDRQDDLAHASALREEQRARHSTALRKRAAAALGAAESTAESITSGAATARALAGIAEALATADPDRAAGLAGEAERTIQGLKPDANPPPMRSPRSISRFRARCTVRAPSGRAVMPRTRT
jgi:hypothetical protein